MSEESRQVLLKLYGRDGEFMGMEDVYLDEDNRVWGDDKLETLFPNADIEFTGEKASGHQQVVKITAK